MGIRFEHPLPAAAGMAAYAVGVGEAKKRQQKYTLDFLADDQRRRDIVGIERSRQMQRQGELMQERQWQTQDMEARRQQELQDDALRYGQQEKQFTEREGRINRSARFSALPEVPQWVTDPAVKKRLTEIRGQINDATYSGEIDWNDPFQAGAVDAIYEEYNAIMGGLKPPSALDEANRDVGYFNEETGQFQEGPIPGQKPRRISTGEPVIDTSQEDAARVKADAAAAAERKDREKQIQDLKKERRSIRGSADPTTGLSKEATDSIAELDAEIAALEQAAPPAAPAPGVTQPQPGPIAGQPAAPQPAIGGQPAQAQQPGLAPGRQPLAPAGGQPAAFGPDGNIRLQPPAQPQVAQPPIAQQPPAVQPPVAQPPAAPVPTAQPVPAGPVGRDGNPRWNEQERLDFAAWTAGKMRDKAKQKADAARGAWEAAGQPEEGPIWDALTAAESKEFDYDNKADAVQGKSDAAGRDKGMADRRTARDQRRKDQYRSRRARQTANAQSRSGKPSIVNSAIEAARGGDVNAQRALDERKIAWRL